MKEWSNKPSSSLTLTSGTTNTVSSSSSSLSNIGNSISTKLKVTSDIATTSSLASPLCAGAFSGVVATGLYGISNIISYVKKNKSGPQAAKDTFKHSAGLGVATGLGLAAANAISGTILALGSTVIVPASTGITVVFITKKIWNNIFIKEQAKS